MTKNSAEKLLKILYVLLILIFIAFIFSNSLESSQVSASKSSYVVKKINQTLENMNSPFLLKEVFVRKSAHFIEFFILGSLVFGFMCMNGWVKSRYIIFPCFFCCLIAMTDETLQYFSKRGSMLLDVWLDLAASVTAILLLYFIYNRYKKRIKDRGSILETT